MLLPLRLCKDCLHFRANSHSTVTANIDYCHAPALVEVSVIRGEVKPVFCSVERAPYGRCGLDAKQFQPHPDTFLATSQEASHVSEEEAEHGNPSF